MSYFAEFPSIQYDIGKTGTSVELTDILRGTRVRSDLKDNTTFYIRYDYKDTDRPEIIANKAYEDPNLHWLVMQMNDVVNPFYDLSISESALSNYITDKYPGQTFFLNVIYGLGSSSSSAGAESYVTISGSYQNDEKVYTTTDTIFTGTIDAGGLSNLRLQGDGSSTDDAYTGAVVLVDNGTDTELNVITSYDGTTKWMNLATPLVNPQGCGSTVTIYPSGTVNRWDATFSRLEVKDIVGTFDKYDTLVGYVSGTQSLLQRKVQNSRYAVHHFENVSTGVWLDPRGGSVDYVGGYIMNTSNPVVEAAVVTNDQHERQLNDNKRFVSLMDPDIAPVAIANFEEAIQ